MTATEIDTTETLAAFAGVNFYKVVTESTGAAYTVDCSDVSSTFYKCSVEGATDGLITATVSAAGVATIPGSTNAEVRTIYLWGK